LAFNPLLPLAIVAGSFYVAVTVEFNRQARVVRVEIQHVAAQRMLASEFQTGEATVAKASPEQPFGDRGIVAKTPRFLKCGLRTLGPI